MMQSGLFDLKAELTRKEQQLSLRKQNASANKGNKTFSKISAMTGKQKKKKNLTINPISETKEIDDESAILFENARVKLEAKSKLYEKMHAGEMEDMENIYGETKFLVDFHRKYEDTNESGSKISGTIVKGCYALFEADEENRERLREKWEQEQQEILDGPVHYENIKFDEVRSLGTGYFAFSKDEETRKEQLAELKKLREDTKNMQSKKDILKNKRKVLLEDRLAKVKRKKLGMTDMETLVTDHNDSNNTKLVVTSENPNTSLAHELKSSTSDVDNLIQECRNKSTITREWDKGKNKRFIEQPFVQPKKQTISYEKIIQARRQDRIDEFAPPSFY